MLKEIVVKMTENDTLEIDRDSFALTEFSTFQRSNSSSNRGKVTTKKKKEKLLNNQHGNNNDDTT